MVSILTSLAQKIIFAVAFVLLLLAPLSQQAQAGFGADQANLSAQSEEDFLRMADSIDGILAVYNSSGGTARWNDPEIVDYFENYIANLEAYDAKLEYMVFLSKITQSYDATIFKRKMKQKRAAGAKAKCLRRAQLKRNKGVAAFRAMLRANQRAKEVRLALGEQNDFLSELIFAQSASVLNPQIIEPWLYTTYDYASSTNGVYFSEFYKKMRSAISILKKCKR